MRRGKRGLSGGELVFVSRNTVLLWGGIDVVVPGVLGARRRPAGVGDGTWSSLDGLA